MKEQYLVLAELRRIDEKALRLQRELEKIPLEVAKLDKTLQGHKDVYLAVKSSVEETEKTLRKTEQDLREKEDFLLKAESKMMEVKNNEEYRAALKENENHKKEKATLEEKILALMNGLEAAKAKLKTAEEEFKTSETKLLQDKSEYETERLKLVKYFEEQSEKRKNASTKLAADSLSLYDKTRAKYKTAAIEIVDNNQCQGCNMRVRSQLYNEVLGMRALHRCPSCGKILISQQIEAELATS